MEFFDKENKLWQTPKDAWHQFDNDKISPGQRVFDAITAHGPKLAQINDETGYQMTYDEIRLKIIRTAQNLLKRGFKPRDVFGFLAEHSDHLVPIMMASMCLACPIAPLHPMLSKDEIIRFFLKAKPSVVFCDISACDQLNEALKELPFSVKVFTFGGQVNGIEPVENLFAETGEESDFVPVVTDDVADIGAIACSSGTTGPSKCICLYYEFSLFTELHAYEPNGIFYCSDAIYWTIGIKNILECLFNGALRIITTKPFTPEIPLQLIDKYKVTDLPIAAFDLIACLKTDLIQSVDLSSVRAMSIYGGHMPNNLIDQMNHYFPNAKINVGYGMTEIGMISFYNPRETKDGGGDLANRLTIKIVDEDGNRCGPNTLGELCVKRERTFRRYHEDPVATAAALDDEGFFLTGDIAYIDDNERLFLKDRKKNVLTLFYYDGILLPFELEECLINMSGIKEVCVVGIPIAGGAVLPAALVVQKPNSNLNKCDIFDKIADTFPKRSWLRAGVYFVNSLAKTSNGKLVRREITKMAIELFEAAKLNDPEIQSYFSDIPIEFRKLI